MFIKSITLSSFIRDMRQQLLEEHLLCDFCHEH